MARTPSGGKLGRGEPPGEAPQRRGAGWLAAAGAIAAGIAIQEYAARRYYATTDGPRARVEEAERTAWTAAWREVLWPAQWLALRRSPVYQGTGVPRGTGQPVVLVHGFLMREAYLGVLREWLERMGYRARLAGEMGWNVDCLDVHASRLHEVVRKVSAETGQSVHLVGHSLGGVLARAIGVRAPAEVASVAVLGTPLRGVRVHPALRVANRVVRAGIHRARAGVPAACHTLACSCDTVRSLWSPLPPEVRQLALVAQDDGLVDRRYCAGWDATGVVEVPTTHLGLLAHPLAYRALAAHLEASSGQRLTPHGGGGS